MDVMDYLLVIRANYKKNSYLYNYSEKLFCQAYCFNFFSSQNNFLIKQIVLIFSLIRAASFSDSWLGILNLKNLKHLEKDK